MLNLKSNRPVYKILITSLLSVIIVGCNGQNPPQTKQLVVVKTSSQGNVASSEISSLVQNADVIEHTFSNGETSVFFVVDGQIIPKGSDFGVTASSNFGTLVSNMERAKERLTPQGTGMSQSSTDGMGKVLCGPQQKH